MNATRFPSAEMPGEQEELSPVGDADGCPGGAIKNEDVLPVVVTHEIGFARQVADEVVFMADGRVCEQGPPSQVIDNPQEEATRFFLGSMASRAEAPVQ